MNNKISNGLYFTGIFLAAFIASGFIFRPQPQKPENFIASSSSTAISSSSFMTSSSTVVDDSFAFVDSVDVGTEIIKGVRRGIKPEHARNLAQILYNESTSTIDYPFLLAVIATESRFNTEAVSPAGAKGLGQLMPVTAQSIAKKSGIDYQPNRLTDPQYNIQLSVKFLERLSKRFQNDCKLVAAAYNGGPGGAKKYKRWMDGEIAKESVHRETLAYVDRVMEKYNSYKTRLQ